MSTGASPGLELRVQYINSSGQDPPAWGEDWEIDRPRLEVNGVRCRLQARLEICRVIAHGDSPADRPPAGFLIQVTDPGAAWYGIGNVIWDGTGEQPDALIEEAQQVLAAYARPNPADSYLPRRSADWPRGYAGLLEIMMIPRRAAWRRRKARRKRAR